VILEGGTVHMDPTSDATTLPATTQPATMLPATMLPATTLPAATQPVCRLQRRWRNRRVRRAATIIAKLPLELKQSVADLRGDDRQDR
jgi:hypothetical protein